MAERVTVELIDRNKLISELMDMELDCTGNGLLGSRKIDWAARAMERFIREDIVQIIRSMPYYTA